MYKVILVVHIMAAIALIAIVLMQRSSGDGMGLSGNSSSSFLSGRAVASFASRATAFLAFVFIATSLVLGVITAHSHVNTGSLADKIQSLSSKPATAPAIPVPATSNTNTPATTPSGTMSAPTPATTPASPPPASSSTPAATGTPAAKAPAAPKPE